MNICDHYQSFLIYVLSDQLEWIMVIPDHFQQTRNFGRFFLLDQNVPVKSNQLYGLIGKDDS